MKKAIAAGAAMAALALTASAEAKTAGPRTECARAAAAATEALSKTAPDGSNINDLGYYFRAQTQLELWHDMGCGDDPQSKANLIWNYKTHGL